MIRFVSFFYIYEGGDDDDDDSGGDGGSVGDGGDDNHRLMPSFISSLNSLHAVKPSFRFRSNARLKIIFKNRELDLGSLPYFLFISVYGYL